MPFMPLVKASMSDLIFASPNTMPSGPFITLFIWMKDVPTFSRLSGLVELEVLGSMDAETCCLLPTVHMSVVPSGVSVRRCHHATLHNLFCPRIHFRCAVVTCVIREFS